MKKTLALLTLALVTTVATASPHYHGHNHNRGLRPAEALILGGIGAIVINEAYRANQPRVIVQPQPIYVPAPVYSTDICAQQQYIDGQYNPPVAQAYCRGARVRSQELQRQAENEAYQRGLSGQ